MEGGVVDRVDAATDAVVVGMDDEIEAKLTRGAGRETRSSL